MTRHDIFYIVAFIFIWIIAMFAHGAVRGKKKKNDWDYDDDWKYK